MYESFWIIKSKKLELRIPDTQKNTEPVQHFCGQREHSKEKDVELFPEMTLKLTFTTAGAN